MNAIPKPLFVAIVDDFPITVLGVTALLRPFGRRARVAAYDGRLPKLGRADIILYDPFVPPNTLTRVREIGRETHTAVLAFSSSLTEAQRIDALMAGAAGVLMKTVDGPALMAALEAVAAGEPIFGATSLTSERQTASATSTATETTTASGWLGKDDGLSAQEAAIVSLVVAGMTNQEIAAARYLSLSAVKNHLRSAYRKMDVPSRTHAVLWGVNHGFELRVPSLQVSEGAEQ